MKKLIIFIVFISLPSIACPKLEGTWKCTKSDGSKHDITFSEEHSNKLIVYTEIDDGITTIHRAKYYRLNSKKETKEWAWCRDSNMYSDFNTVTNSPNSVDKTSYSFALVEANHMIKVTKKTTGSTGTIPKLEVSESDCYLK